jgi:hypothetical protein
MLGAFVCCNGLLASDAHVWGVNTDCCCNLTWRLQRNRKSFRTGSLVDPFSVHDSNIARSDIEPDLNSSAIAWNTNLRLVCLSPRAIDKRHAIGSGVQHHERRHHYRRMKAGPSCGRIQNYAVANDQCERHRSTPLVENNDGDFVWLLNRNSVVPIVRFRTRGAKR